MRYLVTGGAGFIGSHLAETLLRQGNSVCVVDDLSSGNRMNLASVEDDPRLRAVFASCANAQVLRGLVERCDGVFHLASVVGVRRVLASPLQTLTDNLGSTQTVLALASKYGKPVLLASSSEVYGKAQAMPLREDAELRIGSPDKERWSYACSKAGCEFLATAYARERQLPVVIVRLFNTVGPRQSGRHGMVIPTFVHQGLDGRDITVFGDGRQTRCFVHVADVVPALIGLLQSHAHRGDIYNLGSNQPIAMLELANRIRDLTGGRSRVVRIPYQEAYGPDFEEPRERVPDIAKIGHALGWAPRLGLDRILADVVSHCREAAGTMMPLTGHLL